MSGVRSMECWIILGDLRPGIERQQGFNRAGGAGIEGDDSVLDTGAEQEGHVDGDHEAFPLAIGHFEVSEVLGIARYALVARLLHSVEEHGAGVAGAENLARGEFYKVRMVVMQPGTAELAVLDGARCRTARTGEAGAER